MTGFLACTKRARLLATAAVIGVLGSGLPAAAQSGEFYAGWWLELEGRTAWILGSQQPWTASPTTEHVLNDRIGSAWGGRIAAGYRASPTWDFALAYTGLRGNTKKNQVEGYNQVYSVLGPYKTYWNAARLKLTNSVQMGDFEAGYNVGLGSGKVRLIGGLRLIHWSQDTRVDYTYQNYIAFDEKRSRFTGIGPRLAVAGQWPVAQIGRGTLSIQGQVGATIAIGRSHNRWKSYSDTGGSGDLESSDERNKTRLAYNLEGMLAAAYDMEFSGIGVGLALGYRVDAFIRVNDTTTAAGDPNISGIGSLVNAQFGRQHGSSMYHGPLARVTLKF